MSSRVSGHPGRPRLAIRAALLLTILGLVAGPAAPLAAAADANGLTVTTPFPSIVDEAGQHGDLQADDRVRGRRRRRPVDDGRARRLDRSLHRRRPDRSPARSSRRASPSTSTSTSTSPMTRPTTSGQIRVVANGPEGSVTLPITVRRRGRRGRRGDDDLRLPRAPRRGQHDVHVQPDAPQRDRRGADLRARRAGPRSRAGPSAPSPPASRRRSAPWSSPGATASITATAEAPDGTPAGTYPLTVTAAGGGETAQIQLSVVITGSYTVALSTPNQVLSTTANAGSPTDFEIRVTNSGTAPVTAVTPSAQRADRLDGDVRRRDGRARSPPASSRTSPPRSRRPSRRDHRRLQRRHDRQGGRGDRQRRRSASRSRRPPSGGSPACC